MEQWLHTVMAWFAQWLPFLQHTGETIHSTGVSVGQVAAPALQHLDMPTLVALAGALGWASGFRFYAVVFLMGMLGMMHWLPLPDSMAVLQHPAVLVTSGFMLLVEFFADKIPGLDSVWDLLNSVVRVPGGALLAGSVFGLDGGTTTVVAGLLGGTLAATAQMANTTTRAAINTSPEPFSNVLVSFMQDGLVVGIVWLSVNYPVAFAVVLVIAVVLMLITTLVLFRFLRAAWRRLQGWFQKPDPLHSTHA